MSLTKQCSIDYKVSCFHVVLETAPYAHQCREDHGCIAQCVPCKMTYNMIRSPYYKEYATLLLLYTVAAAMITSLAS